MNAGSPALTKFHVYILSDATGITAERVISAVLVQFQQVEPIFERFPFVKEEQEIRDVLARAKEAKGMVIYSLASQKLRDCIRREKEKTDVHTIDLLGPLLTQLSHLLNAMPALHPGLLGEIGEKSVRLAESINFTLKHDDGQALESLAESDLIIIGLSRTSKTPSSLYLSCNYNLKVANIPIILNMEPPREIFTLKNRKVGFIISPDRLAFIRANRFKQAKVAGYADKDSIRKELEYCRHIFRRIPDLQVIDVSSISIEEIANRITEGLPAPARRP
ncbi:MAG: kinase/pyrophosphorylase [Deltaproteobacteria bacterium]|nr:kinase/pyrophosphorylase [Deltaproteobacteria bacterium]